MVRYRHYIRPATAGRWPARVLCIGVDDTMPGGTDSGGGGADVLDHCCVAGIQLTTQGYRTAWRVTLSSPAAWWAMLRRECQYTGYMWVLCSDARRVWDILRLRDELETERLWLVGHDPQQPRPGAHERDRRRDGICIMQCPPAIMQLRPAGVAGQITWLDVANYGVDADTVPAASPECADWLAAWIDAMWRIMSSTELGALQLTAGSTAMHGWRHGYYAGGVYAHDDSGGLELERRAYHGGRAECYRPGNPGVAVWHYDYRSLYPYIGRHTLLPVRLRGIVDDPADAERAYIALPGQCIATVDILSPEPAYPCRRMLPGTTSDGAETSAGRRGIWDAGMGIIYPTGRYTTTLCGPELADAVARGRVVGWHDLCWYDMEACLSDYYRAIYPLRERAERDAHPGIAPTIKRLLNALPGKFGQRDRRWVCCPDLRASEPYGEWWADDSAGRLVRYRSVAWCVYREIIGGYSPDACPAIAGWITSAGRMRLLEAIRTAGWSDVLYCDTDSVMVTEAGRGRLVAAGYVREKEWGYLYLKAGPCKVDLRGVKHYVEDGRVICSGER